MKVILTQSVARLGNKGDVIDVSEGYARNYLIKNGLAKEASKQALLELRAKQQRKESATIEKQAQKITALSELSKRGITLELNKNEQGHLFEKIDKSKLLKILKQNFNLELKDSEIILEDTIREVGDFSFIAKVSGNEFKILLHVA